MTIKQEHRSACNICDKTITICGGRSGYPCRLRKSHQTNTCRDCKATALRLTIKDILLSDELTCEEKVFRTLSWVM